MVSQENIQLLSGKLMNLDTHYSLLEDRDIIFMMNGDVQGQEGSNNNWFAQNVLSNTICYQFPTTHTPIGNIPLNNFEQVIFLSIDNESNSEIGILNTETCTYVQWAIDPCLNFRVNNPIRGVFKFSNKSNKRVIYFIDGFNNNRVAKIDETYPYVQTNSDCDCNPKTFTTALDCSKLDMNKDIKIPCVSMEQSKGGSLLSGVYQLAVSFGEEDVSLTDYYFSPVFKIFSDKQDLSLNVDVQCEDHKYSQMFVALVSTTRENGLVVYNIGIYPSIITKFTINSLTQATVLSSSTVAQKGVLYDNSEHIATNSEVLLLGRHKAVEPLPYQKQAINIEVKWAEFKVKGSEAHKYPSMLRDEVYAISLEWFNLKGKSRGLFHIPGRAPMDVDIEAPVGTFTTYNELDDAPIGYQNIPTPNDSECNPITLKVWEVSTNPTVETDLALTCDDCGLKLNRTGKMAYYECKDLTYPDTSDWGSLGCQKIRHHKMPSHNVSHIYGSRTGETWSAQALDCVNILGIQLLNIEHPKLADGSYDPDISGYRIWISDRQGNKSILHKGLMFNCRREFLSTATGTTEVLYPNYPYNDLHSDVFLSETQTFPQQTGTSDVEANYTPVDSYSDLEFTYHSPDIHYRETSNEQGQYITSYGEELGEVEGGFTPVYKHPSVALGLNGTPSDFGLYNYAYLNSSVATYNRMKRDYNAWQDNNPIVNSQYLLPIKQILPNNLFDLPKKINNLNRESSYYLALTYPIVYENTDTTRILASDISCAEDVIYYTSDDEVTRTEGDVPIEAVSKMVAVKVRQYNQYGNLEQIKYKPANYCVQKVTFDSESPYYTSDPTICGDVYISKHSIVRKMPLFNEWLYDVPFDTEYDYRDKRNVYYPRFWYDNLTTANDSFRLDCFTDIDPDGTNVVARGKFYLFVTGVLNFYCESEFIGNYRESDYTPNGMFYPKESYTDLVRSDKFTLPEKFLYNLSLLTQNFETGYQDLDPASSDAKFVVSVSQKDDPQAAGDKWLQFLPLNYTILPRIHGEFTGMHYTDNYSIFFIFENEILYAQMNYSLETSEGNRVTVTQGDVFSNRLARLSNEATGYVGSVDPLSFINTRYGTYFVDRARKKIFQWSGSLKEVTGNMQSFFNRYLDNRLYDYLTSIRVVFDNLTENVYFVENNRIKWNLTYKPKLEGFVSFNSWIPEGLITLANNFVSVYKSGYWRHNAQYSYQNYYGVQSPFEIGLIINNKFKNAELQSVELFSEWIEYQDYGQYIYKRNQFFDKIAAYNNNGSTGIMPVVLKEKEAPLQSILQNADSPIIEVSPVSDSIFRFNKFSSLRKDNNSTPLMVWDTNGTQYTLQSIDQNIPPHLREDIKGKWIKLHLISDMNNKHKILVQLLVPNTDDIIS